MAPRRRPVSTYIADAAAFGAEVFTGIRVLSLSRDEQHGWRVWAMPTDADTHRGHRYFITADIVVLAAGTLGSTEILLRSRAEGLALSDWLGSRFTSNGDAIALAYNNDVPVNGIGVGQPPKAQVAPVGQAVNALIDLRDTADVRDGLAMCECALPSAFASALPGLLAPGAAIFGEHEDRSLGDKLEAMERATDSLIKGAYQGAVHNTQTFLAVGHDAGNGLMRLDDDRLAIEWTNGPQQRVFQRIEDGADDCGACHGRHLHAQPGLGKGAGRQSHDRAPARRLHHGREQLRAASSTIRGRCSMPAAALRSVRCMPAFTSATAP